MATTKIPVELSSTPGIVDNSNATAITIDSSEKVGIGTTTPAKALQVKTDTNGDGVNIQRNSTTADHYGQLSFSVSTNDSYTTPNVWIRGVRGSSYTNNFMTFGTGGNTGTEAMRIDSSQQVGIGLTSPSEKLHIYGTGATISGKVEAGDGNQASLDLKNSEGEFRLICDGGTLYIYDQTDTAERFRIDTSGQVGIGTTSPSYKLEVNSGTSDWPARFISSDDKAGIIIADNDTVNYLVSRNSFLSIGSISDLSATNLNVKSSGEVGIGTTSPGHALDVVGTGKPAIEATCSAGHFAIEASTPYDYVAKFSSTDSGAAIVLQDNSSTNHANRINVSGDNMQFVTGATTAVTINASQNVGIGTTTPGTNLHIGSGTEGENLGLKINRGSTTNFLVACDGTKQAYIGVDSSEGFMKMGSLSNHPVRISQNNANAIYIDTSKNIGIGTTSPGHKVHIYGGSAHTNLVISTADGYKAELRMTEDAAGTTHGGFIRYDGNGDYVRLGTYNAGAESINLSLKDDTKIGTGGITVPQQNFAVGTTTNYDPPGLGSSNANFAVLKKDGSTGGNYGIITGVSSDGNVWTQVQRTDGTATGYNYYLQPSGGNVAIGVPQNHTYIPNLTSPLHVCKVRSGVGNVSDYLTHLAIEALGYAGNNYQLGCIDFNGGDTAGAHNPYARIGCSTMVGTNNQETGSLEFYVKAPSFGLSGTTHAMKITGKADTSSAGGGTTRNGVLFTYQGIAIDRSWSDYPGIAVMNATPYSSTASTQSELRIHGTNISSASYPSTSGSDFSVVTRSDGGYATGSDRRRKKNITTIDNALSTVKQLTGKRFQTVNSADEVQEHVSKNGYKFGFIAQEVEDIIPETVQYHADEDDGTDNYNTAYAMDYGSVVALLVNAIKEQDTTIVALEARIKALEDK